MFTIMLVLLFRPVGAQTEDAFPSYIEQCFNNYFNFNPQEKIYLHTDKPTYSAGENIWFRAYCVDASYHIPTQLSKFIYLELINRQDSILKRIQIKQTDSCFYGNLTIPSTTPPGEYCLRVFTNWMQNNEEDFFFKKNIQIVSTVNEVNIHTASSRQDNAIRTTLTLIDNAGKPYVHQRLKITTYRHKLAVNKTTLKTDEQGSATLQYPVSDSIDRIQVAFPTDLPFAFSREIPLLNLSDDFDFQFFPEGGNLLAGTTQTVAFKALDANGRSIAAEGKIYNSKEQEVVSFSTSHRGMGTLELTTQPGERYYALVHTATNREKRVDLQIPQAENLALQVYPQDNHLILAVKKGIHFPAGKTIYIVMHSRGRLLGVLPAKDDFVGALPLNSLPGGTVQFVLADADSHIYSQRSYFIKPDPQPVLQLRTDKEKYDRREKVNLTLQFTDIGEHPLEGSFSLSVTDNTMVPRDTLSDNIVSYLLLTSDLKGHIEAPGSYSRETPEHIDLLMLTHGWTRYEIGKFLTATPSKATFKLEQGQEIRGKITNYSNKPMANASVQIFIPGENTLGEVKSNENGEFIIRDLDFRDSTIFLMRGYKEKGGKMVDITITPRLFKDPVTHFTIPRENKPLGKEEFMDQFKGSYFYQNGVKVYILDEAVVLRHRPESVQHKYEGQYTDMTDYILGQEELNKFNTSSIYQLLSRLPGVIVSGTKVTMARNGSTPLFMIDGLPQTEDMLNAVMPEDVDNLGVIRDGARLTFFMAQGGAGGVIVINTKHGHFTPKATPGLIKFIPLGYSEPDEFYMPQYNDPEILKAPEIDYRSTIYWQPVVPIDSSGQTSLSFFTADMAGSYTITVEGLGKNGEPVYRQTTIRRE